MFGILKRQIKIPVLCYHSMMANTSHYLGNDHIALEEDLALLESLGYRIISATQLADLIRNKKNHIGLKRACCITFDDAPAFDYADFYRPSLGKVLSFRSILLKSSIFTKSKVPVTSFAIASETARTELDRTCIEGKGEWSSTWWREAIASKIFQIANHSLDHMHGTLQSSSHSRGEKGNFFAVDNYRDADLQIRQAQDELDKLTNGLSVPLFAYPFGHVNDYLAYEYFPQFQQEHRQIAAFSTAGDFAHIDSNIWSIPRFVCGHHWKSKDDLLSLLHSTH